MAAQLALFMPASAAQGNTGNNPTWLENQNAGTPNWQVGLAPYHRSDDFTKQIQGYASATSINKGETITFYITVNPAPQTYTIDVYRVGWYGGKGGQLKLHAGVFTGVSQPRPSYDSSTGMIVCPWAPSYTLNTSQPTLDSTGWTSGIYLALLTNTANYQNWIVFAIRDDARLADLIFQQSVTTYQAYNNYPADGATGKSLYDGGSSGPVTALGTQRAVKVSFDRPYTYTDHTGAGELLHYDIFFIRWLERNGYDVVYSTDIDTHTSGARLLQFKAFLSVGHDEYWTRQMYDNAYAARDAGTSLGFFGANAVSWQIRLEPSTLNGRPNRVIAGYKNASLDPYNNPSSPLYNPQLTTVEWRSSILHRPEQQLQGTMYTAWISADGRALPYIVQNSQTASGQAVYGGTGLIDGSSVPGVLGYEFDKQFTNYNTPLTNTDLASHTTVVPGSYTLLSNSPFTDAYGNADHSNSSIYQSTSGAWVFNAGTMYWNWGLDSYTPPAGITTYAVAAPSPALQKATANILNLFINAHASTPLAAPSNLTATPAVNAIALTWQNNAPTATANTVQRSTDNATWTTLTSTLAGNATTYTNSNITGSFYYRVQATDSSGHSSAFSNTAFATTSSTATSLSLSPAAASLAVSQGGRATDAITATLVSGSAIPVTFSTSALPAGVTASFSVASCTVTCGTTVTISASTTAATGTSSVVITAAGPGSSASTTIALTITATAPASGLAAQWKLDEGSGATTADASGNANTGTLTNATWVTGSYGTALAFSGSNSYVSVNESPSIGMSTQLTVSFWMSAQNNSNLDPRIIAKLYDWDVKLNGSGRFPQLSSGGKYAMLQTPSPLNTWLHVAFTFSSGLVKGYINGVPVAFSVNTFTGTETLPQWQYGLRIGTDPSGTNSFIGAVDDVRVYQRALSDAEVLAIYTGTVH